MKRFLVTILAYALILQPFMVWGASPVYNLECTSTGCSDIASTPAVAVSAAVAGTRTRVGSDGLLSTVAVDTVRTQYADGKWRMMSEGLAANLCTYSDDFTQASWAKVTMTAAKTQTGPDGVANSASLITATGANSTILFTTASSSASHTASFWLKLVTGTGTVNITVNNGSTWTAKTITTSWVKYDETQTVANPVIGIRLVTSGDAVAVFGAQCEKTAYPTSTIQTSGSIVVRAPEEGAVDLTDIYSVVNLTVDAINFTDGSAAADFAAVNLDEYVKTGNRYRITLLDDEGDAAVGFIYADDPANAGGALIVSATGGTTQNWASKAAGFNDADTEYTVTIEYVETNGYYQANASLWGGDGWDAGTDMDTAGTMIVDWWPLTAQTTYPTTEYLGILNLTTSTIYGLLYLNTTTVRMSSYSTANNAFQSNWATAANHKIGLTWETGANIELYQNGLKSTDVTNGYGGSYADTTNFIFFYNNHMPTLLSGLKFYSVAATEAKTASSAASDTFTASVIDGVTGVTPSIKGLWIQSGHTTCEIDRVTAAGLQYDFYFDEDLATNFINSIAVGHGDAIGVYVATGKAVTGDYNAFPSHSASPDAEYTQGAHDVFATDPLFTSESTGVYSLTAGSPMIDAGTGTTADINSVAGAGNGYADTPTNATPADAATKIARKPTLTASAVSITGGTDIGAYEFVSATHTGSQWQLCSDALCASAVYDSGDDAVNLESIGVTYRLDPKTSYYFRVKYETAAGWSEWSTITEFETRSIGGGRMELGLGLSLN